MEPAFGRVISDCEEVSCEERDRDAFAPKASRSEFRSEGTPNNGTTAASPLPLLARANSRDLVACESFEDDVAGSWVIHTGSSRGGRIGRFALHAKLRSLVAGQFESARSGFADYARDGETDQQLRTRVSHVILEDLEQEVIALHQLHEKLRDRLGGPSFGDLVARGRPSVGPF